MLKVLEYPFDSAYLLENKRKIKKELLSSSDNFIEKKIAILGGSTTAAVKQMMELFLLNNGIKPSFYESEYNKFYEDAMFENVELKDFNPDIIYVHTTNRNIRNYPSIAMSKEEVDELLNDEYRYFENIWKSLKDKYGCVIIQNNFEKPYYRLMGNKDFSDIHGKVNYINRLNSLFAEYANSNENFYICDIDYISADYGLSKWADQFYFHMYKYGLNVNAIPYLSFNVANIIKSIYGKNKKGFVLDLDNTLWGGVIGDDGVDGISLGVEEAKGSVYSEFQKYLKETTQLGIILNIDSKNEYENAIAGLNHPDSELKEDDFVEIKANWDPKDKNFKEIAETINLLPESLVFVDDNPAERYIVSEQLKGVSAPELNNPEKYIEIIDRNGYFETTVFSKDDLKRNQMYKDNARRARLEASFEDYHDYLLSLDMKGIIKPFESIYYERITQLSNKSNQYNLTTRRYTQSEIEEITVSDKYISLYGKLIDKFGDNGLVSVSIGSIEEDTCSIDLWLMSCRVLKRDFEYAMMDTFVEKCKQKGIKKIIGNYYPTAKNKMVADFYDLQGFTLIEEKDGNKKYELLIDDYQKKNTVIELENNNE
ncbi:MAG: HAD-IIIC family phosphatase [Erysipelotrichaceae bacterium]|nr:HAD-IIIC family phosphatase [Erysipelotrichaceae bacterium]